MLTNTELTQFLISTVVLLIMAHSVGHAEWLRLPRRRRNLRRSADRPSALGFFMPGVTEWLVPDELLNGKLLSAVYWA